MNGEKHDLFGVHLMEKEEAKRLEKGGIVEIIKKVETGEEESEKIAEEANSQKSS